MPNAVVRKVHNRMPVIIQEKDEDFWLNPENQDFFESEGGPEEDFHNLDRDADGVACESL